jgi:hypothetical protein
VNNIEPNLELDEEQYYERVAEVIVDEFNIQEEFEVSTTHQTTSTGNNTTEVIASTSTASAIRSTPSATPCVPLRKHRKLEESNVEKLMKEQAELMRQQVQEFKDIKGLMNERNRIENEQLELKKRKVEQSNLLNL